MVYTLTLPIRTQSINVSHAGEHWAKRAKRAREHREAVAVAWAQLPVHRKPKPPCSVKMTRIAPRALDSDNLQGALKSVRDGIATQLGLDDRDAAILWSYDQAKPDKPKHYAVKVLIETSARKETIMQETRNLPVALTEIERSLKNQELVTLTREQYNVETEKKEITKDFSERLKALRQRIQEVVLIVEQNQQFAEVECVIEVDLDKRMTTVTRQDTAEVIEERTATEKEIEHASQRRMFADATKTA